MSYHRYVMQARPEYFQTYLTFPENQCVFITDDDETQIFRGGYSVPLLAGTQNSNFILTQAQQLAFQREKSFGREQIPIFRDLMIDQVKNLSYPKEAALAIKNKGFKTSIIANELSKLPDKHQELLPYTLDKKIKFAGVSSFNQTPADVASGLVEVNSLVQGVATIFPRPTPIPISERMNPGDYYEESIPVYKEWVGSIRIGRILDFPNPHSVRVVIEVGSTTSIEAN